MGKIGQGGNAKKWLSSTDVSSTLIGQRQHDADCWVGMVVGLVEVFLSLISFSE